MSRGNDISMARERERESKAAKKENAIKKCLNNEAVKVEFFQM